MVVFMEGVKFTPTDLQSAVSNLMVNIDMIGIIIAAIKIFSCVEFANVNAHFLTGDKCWITLHHISSCCTLFPCVSTSEFCFYMHYCVPLYILFGGCFEVASLQLASISQGRGIGSLVEMEPSNINFCSSVFLCGSQAFLSFDCKIKYK